MIVDSSALAEQVVADVLASAFDSAGQRCSALRVLCVQDDVADRVLAMLLGAMAELRVGDPARLCTDVGPVIDEAARAGLLAHIERMRGLGCRVFQCALPGEAEVGCFVPPTLIEIDRVDRLQREVFGPVLHVLRYARDDLEATLRMMVKLELGAKAADFDVGAYLREPPAAKGVGKLAELFRANPLLPKRITALRAFADGALYASARGRATDDLPSTDAIDKQVTDLLSLF